MDVYLYTAGSSGQSPLHSLLPPAWQADLQAAFDRLADPSGVEAGARDLAEWSSGPDASGNPSPFWTAGGPSGVVLTRTDDLSQSDLWGLSFEEIAGRPG